MVYVNGNWEMVHDLYDVSRVVREYYNSDLADEMDKLIKKSEPEHSDDDYYSLECDMNDMLNEICAMEDELGVKEIEIEDLKEEISELKEKIFYLEERSLNG